MKITWLGTAAIRLEADGETVLFDPFVQLVGGENPNCLDDFLQDQTICVTHGHLDHMMDVPEFLDPESDAEATVYCGEVAAETLSDMVENTSNVVKVRPGDVIRLGDVRILVMEGKHAKPGKSQVFQKLFSRRFLQYFRNALALAYLNPKFPEGGQTLMDEVYAEAWTGPICYEQCTPERTAAFPVTEEGLAQLRTWLEDNLAQIDQAARQGG